MHIGARLISVALLAFLAAACSGGESDAAPGPTTGPGSPTTSVGQPDDGPVDDTAEPDSPERLSGTFTKLSEPGVGGRITSVAFDPVNPDRVFVGGDMLGIAVTNDFGQSWSSTTGLVSWEIGDIQPQASADGRIWTGSLSGPQASADGGETWASARSGMPAVSETRYSMPIETILVDPTTPDRLLAFNGNQRNWSAPGVYANGEWQGDGSVWQSTDSGTTWSQLGTVAPGGNTRAATFAGNDPNVLYAAVANRGVWKSTDGGATWFETATGLPHFNSYDILADPADPNRAWVAMGEGPLRDGRHIAGGIWVTVDGGQNWSAANDGLNIVSNQTPGNTGSFHQIVASPADPNRLYTSNVAPGQAAIYRSDDAGSTWRVIADASTERPNPYQGALRAYDIGVHPTDPDRIVIGSDDTLLGSTDGGDSWTDLTTDEGSDGFFTGRGYSGLVSTDIVFDERKPDDLILLGFDGGNFIQTIDGGLSWRRTIQDISAWGGGVEAAYSPTDPDRIYVLLGQFSNFRGIGISTDGGATFNNAVGAASGLPEIGNVPGGARGLAIVESAGPDIVLAVIGELLYRSDDGGATFAAVPGMTTMRDVSVAGDGETVYAATDDQVMVSTDRGLNFNGTPSSPVGITNLFNSTAEPLAIYGVAFRDGAGGVFRFDGAAWTPIFDDRFAHGIAVDPENPANLAIVTSEPAFHDVSFATGVYLSDDGGATWMPVTDGLPMNRLRTVEFDPNEPDRLVVGTTGRGFYEVSFELALAG